MASVREPTPIALANHARSRWRGRGFVLATAAIVLSLALGGAALLAYFAPRGHGVLVQGSSAGDGSNGPPPRYKFEQGHRPSGVAERP